MIPRFRLGTDEMMTSAFIKPDDFFKHVFIMGKTGAGKSVILERLIQDCYFNRQPLILVDPSGSLSRTAYNLCNGKAMYCSLKTPISLNPLVTPYTDGQKVDILVECINQMIVTTTPNEGLYANMIRILFNASTWCFQHGRHTLE